MHPLFITAGSGIRPSQACSGATPRRRLPGIDASALRATLRRDLQRDRKLAKEHRATGCIVYARAGRDRLPGGASGAAAERRLPRWRPRRVCVQPSELAGGVEALGGKPGSLPPASSASTPVGRAPRRGGGRRALRQVASNSDGGRMNLCRSPGNGPEPAPWLPDGHLPQLRYPARLGVRARPSYGRGGQRTRSNGPDLHQRCRGRRRARFLILGGDHAIPHPSE